VFAVNEEFSDKRISYCEGFVVVSEEPVAFQTWEDRQSLTQSKFDALPNKTPKGTVPVRGRL